VADMSTCYYNERQV